jgi:hypothetical protein
MYFLAIPRDKLRQGEPALVSPCTLIPLGPTPARRLRGRKTFPLPAPFPSTACCAGHTFPILQVDRPPIRGFSANWQVLLTSYSTNATCSTSAGHEQV